MNPTGMCESETESKQDVQSINSSTAIENPSDSTTEEQYLSGTYFLYLNLQPNYVGCNDKTNL